MSDTKVESTIRDVRIGGVSTKPIQEGTKTLWLIKTIDGPEVSTIRAELGNAAKILMDEGKAADMQVSIVQKGQYTNYYLNKIQAAASGMTTPVEQAINRAQAAQVNAGRDMSFEEFSKVEQAKIDEAARRETERNLSIHRQTAAKVSASLNPETQEDFWQNVDALLHFFQTGATPFSAPEETSVTSHTVPPPNAGPEFEQGADDDIPF